jgi:class 3 adenylate cyclase
MASFSEPRAAVDAALAILEEVDRLNEEHHAEQIILKLGIHAGASIAVTLNERLDYFGQTINIASRVENLAHANEVCITDDVYNAEGVQERIHQHTVTSSEEHLKGVQRGHLVHRIKLATLPVS